MNPAIFDKPSGVGALLGPGDIATPTAGYSLRYLSINYIGQPVVEVRKDVAGNPTQLFTPNQLTDGTLAAFADGNNCYVSKWYDQFGSNDATQTTAAEQPKIWDASTGLVTENGKPTLDFDGVDDKFIWTISGIQTATNLSTFITSTTDSATSPDNPTHLLIRYANGGGNDSFKGFQYAASSGSVAGETFILMFSSNTVDGGRLASTTYSRSANTQTVCSLFNLSTGSSFYENAVNINIDLDFRMTTSTDTSPSAADIASDEISTKTGQSGTYQEIIIYNSDQSANRQAIEDNINDYYDIY